MQQERLRAAEEAIYPEIGPTKPEEGEGKETEGVVAAEVTVGATGIEEASIGAEEE